MGFVRVFQHAIHQIADKFLCDEIINKERVVFQKLKQSFQLVLLVTSDYVLEDKCYPFWYMDFKLMVISNQLKNDLVDPIVHFSKFLLLVGLCGEDFHTKFRLPVFDSFLSISILSHEE